MVMVACGSVEEALEISNLLVRKRLAACVNILPIRSIYDWQGKVEDHAEHLLLIKTVSERFDSLREAVQSLHSYDTPEIVSIDISESSPDYADWVRKFTHGQ